MNWNDDDKSNNKEKVNKEKIDNKKQIKEIHSNKNYKESFIQEVKEKENNNNVN